MASRAHLIAALGASLLCTTARAKPPEKTPELDAERDALIEKIIRGEDLSGSVKAFAALVKKRDPLIPTSAAAKQAAREKAEARRAWQAEWRKTADSEVGWRCRLSVDPKNPQKSDGWEGDWGRVTKKEQVRLAPKNELDDGELVTVYEVKGQRRTYRFRGENFGIFRQRTFEAEQGDLVLVCDGGTDTVRDLPEPWSKDFQRSGFAVRLKSVPLIAKKGRWNPIHITENKLFWAVKDVKWRFPPDAYVLSVVDIEEDLGNGRYLITLTQGLTAMLEVPPHVQNRHLLVPGQSAWAIMGKARFDRTVKKLVLTVEDLEARYIDEIPLPDDETAQR